MRFDVYGEPYPFSTNGEKQWKQDLIEQIPQKNSSSTEMGAILSFEYNPILHNSLLDVDNICDPVFSILINNKGWFGGQRPNMQWYRATKKQGSKSGCTVEMVERNPIEIISEKGILFDKTFIGTFPNSATDQFFSSWVEKGLDGRLENNDHCMVQIQFGSAAVNLGDIATGKTKPIIDCLFPVLGGTSGDPDDDRISTLQVEKGVKEVPLDGVRIFVAKLE